MILFSRIVSRTSLLHIWKCNDLELFAVRSSDPPALEPLVPRLEPSSLADRLSLRGRIEVLGRSTTLDRKLTMKRTRAPDGSILLHDTPRMLAASILFASSCLLTVVQLKATKGALRPRRHLLSKVLMLMRHPMEMCMKSTRMRKGSEHTLTTLKTPIASISHLPFGGRLAQEPIAGRFQDISFSRPFFFYVLPALRQAAAVSLGRLRIEGAATCSLVWRC